LIKVVSRRLAIISHDLIMVVLAWVLAYLTRYNFSLNPALWDLIWQSLLIVGVTQGLILWVTGLYKGLWRFASIPDLWNITRAAVLGALGVSLALFLFNRLEGVPRTILLFYPIFLIVLLGAPRLFYRMWKDHSLNWRQISGQKRVLIIGAGRAGELLARDIGREGEYQPIGFLDDNRRLKGAKVHGLPVLGRIDDLPDITDSLSVDIIIIAIPSATNTQMQRVVGLCEQTGLPFRTLPRMQDLVSGQYTVQELREVSIDDLLGRDPVSLDWEMISEGMVGKTVMVSGGGGSIGSELCRQIARLGPSALVVIDQSEFNLYSIENELRHDFPALVFHACLGDVCDFKAVENIMMSHQPDIVFHAAAYKQVPMLETQAREAIRNNVIGTKIMAQAADKFGSATFVMISTDKAVNPANVMGASKRISEIYCQTLSKRSKTHYITVRFGNVLGSTGSVVPLFRKQIEAGGPVTVTHPKITRYFMTIPEAAQLILQAAVMSEGGEIFVLDMGKPVKISYLAEQMIRLSGKEPGEDIKIEFTGLRPGEKLYEELFYSQEDLVHTRHEKILLARSCDVDWDMLSDEVGALEQACYHYNEPEINAILNRLVPELGEQQQISATSNVVAFNRAQVPR